MTNSPRRGTHFTFTGWDLSPSGKNEAAFHYTCDVHGAFTERVRFPSAAKPLSDLASTEEPALLTLLGVALGVSYYKLAAADRIVLPPLTPAGRAMAAGLYGEGLAEFSLRAGLPYPRPLEFDADTIDPAPTDLVAPHGDGSALVAFGGGKDSHVALRILHDAGRNAQLASVILSDAVGTVLDATAPVPPLKIRRFLDPRLADRTPHGYSGHIPITAINSLILAIAAWQRGEDYVVFANERSADEPTMVLDDGTTANHQYSKSSAFESLLRNAVRETRPTPPFIYSVLRPFSELWIGKAFSRETSAFRRFTSCNRNFRLAGDADQRWCGTCAKCAFTSLITAPFVSGDEAVAMFGSVLLDAPALMPQYEELLGLSDHKPWDCVGTIDECRAALWHIGQGGPFKHSEAVRRFLPQLNEVVGEAALRRAWDTALAPGLPGSVPKPEYSAAMSIGDAVPGIFA